MGSKGVSGGSAAFQKVSGKFQETSEALQGVSGMFLVVAMELQGLSVVQDC